MISGAEVFLRKLQDTLLSRRRKTGNGATAPILQRDNFALSASHIGCLHELFFEQGLHC